MARRRVFLWGSALAALGMLSACGDGSGGGSVASAGSTPVNASLAALQVSQKFTNDAASTTAAFVLSPPETISNSAAAQTLTISYDAGSNSYSVSAAGRSQSFAPADKISESDGQAQFKKTGANGTDYLTLTAASFTGATKTGPQYVGVGYWQRNTSGSNRQDTTFDIFTYGLPTPASTVPRSGQASYAINVFGLSTTPGYEPAAFSGTGRFDLDFGSGVFSAAASTTETGLVTDSGVSGGGIGITAAGQLSASDGSFTGTVGYGGFHANGVGTLAGRLYGPAGSELGAAFSASGADGSATTGAFIGLRDATLPAVNLTLTNLVADQLFYVKGAQLESGPDSAWTYVGVSQMNRTVAGTFSISPVTSDLPGGTFTVADQVPSSDANFTAYQKTIGGQVVSVDLYKPGSGNSELALSYLSLGRWGTTLPQGSTNMPDARYYFVYGLESDRAAIAARSGTAHYDGVAYGGARNTLTGAAYDVKGTSAFDVDFGHSTYSGSLALKGSGAAGSADFGSFAFASTLNAGYVLTADVTRAGATVGSIAPAFFGPSGQEIGAPFQITLINDQPGRTTSLVGVAVARAH